jgi:hypothetical protein
MEELNNNKEEFEILPIFRHHFIFLYIKTASYKFKKNVKKTKQNLVII